MTLTELSNRSGITTTTIKYYIREGLLPQGQRATATRAKYSEEHLHRLRLIRTLINVRQLPVSTVKEILTTISRQHDTHRTSATLTNGRPASPDRNHEQEKQATQKQNAPGAADAHKLITEIGWHVDPATAALHSLSDVLHALSELGTEINWQALLPYARLADRISELDIEQINHTPGPQENTERTMLVYLLLEPALLALRRLAHENKTARLTNTNTKHQPPHLPSTTDPPPTQTMNPPQ